MRAYAGYIFSSILFGINGIVASYIHLASSEIVLFRTWIGGIFLVLLFGLGKYRFTFYQYKKECAFIGIAGLAMGASWMFLYEAYQQVGVSIATLTYYSGPILVMALAPVVYKERITWKKLVGFAAVVLGLLWIVGGDNWDIRYNTWGLVCGFSAAAMYAVMVLFNKRAVHIRGMENTILQLAAAGVLVSVFVGVRVGWPEVQREEEWIPFLVLGVINTGIGCYFYFSSIGNLPVQTVAVCGYLEPLFAVLFSALFLGERLAGIQLLGVAFMIAGAVYSEVWGAPQKECMKTAVPYDRQLE